MAAHPFGPIEKFLITSCKPLKNDPRDAKLVFGDKQCFECPSVEDNLFWGFCQPRHVLEPTANVNSSDYKVQTALKVPEKEVNEGMYSLSRGLGYRITFTMPADREWRLDFTELWPSMEIQVLDFFGEKVLASFKYEPSTGNDTAEPQKEPKRTIHPEDFSTTVEVFQTAERLYGKMGTLTLELTSLGVKAYKDSEVVLDVPFYSKEKTDDPKLREFGIFDIWSVTDSSAALEVLLARLEGFAYYFNKNHSKVTKEQLLRAKPALMGLMDQLASIWKHLGPKVRTDEQDDCTLKLKRDIVAWMDGRAPYPIYFNCKFVSEMKIPFKLRSEKYQYHRNLLPGLAFTSWRPQLQRIFENVLKSPDLGIVDVGDCSRKYFTKDFTIVVRNAESPFPGFYGLSPTCSWSRTAFFETKYPDSGLKDAFLSHGVVDLTVSDPFEVSCVVPDLNLTISGPKCVDFSRELQFWWRIVDLEKAHAVHTGKSTEAPFADIMISIAANQFMPTLEPYACRTGFFIRHKNAMEFYSYDALFARKADEEYLRIPIVLGEDREQKVVDLSVKESKRGREFYFMAKIKKTTLPDKPKETDGPDAVYPDSEDDNEDNQSADVAKPFSSVSFDYFSFVRLSLSSDLTNITVTAKCEHRFEEHQGGEHNMLWVEDKSGRMIGCIEAPIIEGGEVALLVYALIYMNRKFIPLRINKKLPIGRIVFEFKDNRLIRPDSSETRAGWKEWESGEWCYSRYSSKYKALLLVDKPTYTEDGAEIMCISHLQLKF